jgi:dephospho-CoA kinase
MPVIAITGGLGSGKSTVREIFEELGAKGLDTDAISRQVVESGTPGAEKIRELFGDSFFTSEGELNRKMMAAHVFSNPAERQKLESILHPLIREAESDMVKKFLNTDTDTDTDTVVVVEIPLLAEGGRSAQYDGVVLVTAPMGIRLERLVKSGKYTREEAASRIANQADDAKREQIASWTVENAGSFADTRSQVRTILRTLVG